MQRSIQRLIQGLIIIRLRIGICLISLRSPSLKLKRLGQIRIFILISIILLFLITLIEFDFPSNSIVLVWPFCRVIIVLNDVIRVAGKVGIWEYWFMFSFKVLLVWLLILSGGGNICCSLVIRLRNEGEVHSSRAFAGVLILKASYICNVHGIEWCSTPRCSSWSPGGGCSTGSSSCRCCVFIILRVLPSMAVLIRNSICLKFSTSGYIGRK